MSAIIRKILRVEPGISLGQWVYDTVASNWPRLVTLFVAGGGMTYLSAITEWTAAIGPAGIGLVVIGTVLVANLLLSQAQALRAKATKRNALAAASETWVKSADSINPLDADFQRKRIRIEELAHPLGKHVPERNFQSASWWVRGISHLSRIAI